MRDGIKVALGVNSVHGALAWVVAGTAVYYFSVKPELDKKNKPNAGSETSSMQSKAPPSPDVHHARVTDSGAVQQDSSRQLH